MVAMTFSKRVHAVRTFSPKQSDITRAWLEVDATGMTLGRLSTEVASRLRGKHKPIFSPHVDTGDHIIVVNADKIALDVKKADQKLFQRHSGFPGGLKTRTYGQLLEKTPDELIRISVRGMLPKNTLGRQMLLKLKVYAGPEHPHQAQGPVKIDFPQARKAS
jgi:large subunit ribosomal protein L13